MKRFASTLAAAIGLALIASATPIARGTQAPAGQSQDKQTQAPAKPTPPTEAAAQKSEQPGMEQPADFKAFNQASSTTDPKQRIEALQKFIKDYPDSELLLNASSAMRTQFLTSAAESTRQYLAEADKYVKASRMAPLMTYYLLASELMRSGVMLDQAEEFALKGLQAEDEAKYVQSTRERAKQAAAERAKRPQAAGIVRFTMSGGRTSVTLMPRTDATATPPRERTDEELRADYRSQRGQLQATLGQIYLKRGKNADAERLFKEVYANPDVDSGSKAVAVRELANFARKAGDDKALVQYLMESVVAGARPGTYTELRDAYKKTHNGSLDGLEATLDAMYAKSLPKIDAKPYDRPKTKEPRVVLAELFTGSECPPCVGIDLAFDAALERYNPEDVALLVYHEHIPGPDPMTNPSTEKRLKFYGVRGVPTYYIDGKTDGAGGGGADQAERYFSTRVKPAIELNMGVAPEARLALKASMAGSTVRVKASVANVKSKSDKLRLQIVLAEERLRYQGGNGVRYHPMVVRSVAIVSVKGAKPAAVKPADPKQQASGQADSKQEPGQADSKQADVGPAQGFAVSAGKGVKVDYTFDLAKIAAENKGFIDDFLTKPFRGGDKPSFSSRMDDIDARHLVVVAFVQDEDLAQGKGERVVGGRTLTDAAPLRHVLQAAVVRIGSAKTTN